MTMSEHLEQAAAKLSELSRRASDLLVGVSPVPWVTGSALTQRRVASTLPWES